MAYLTGGALGLLLLFLRIAVYESGMYEKTKSQAVSKGNFFALFTNIKRFRKFAFCTLLALPTWYTVSVLAINAPSFAQDALHISGVIKGSTSVMVHYIGASLGSFLFGYLSIETGIQEKGNNYSHYFHCTSDNSLFLIIRASPAIFYFTLSYWVFPWVDCGQFLLLLHQVWHQFTGNGYTSALTLSEVQQF